MRPTLAIQLPSDNSPIGLHRPKINGPTEEFEQVLSIQESPSWQFVRL